jgi:hypothetical protein
VVIETIKLDAVDAQQQVQVAVAMAGDRKGLPVMYRVEFETGKVFALLPTLPTRTKSVADCMCHVEGGINYPANVYNAVRNSRPARRLESRELAEELRRIYAGNDLIAYEMYNPWFNRTRGTLIMKQAGYLD